MIPIPAPNTNSVTASCIISLVVLKKLTILGREGVWISIPRIQEKAVNAVTNKLIRETLGRSSHALIENLTIICMLYTNSLKFSTYFSHNHDIY